MSTILEIIQAITQELGLPEPAIVVGSNDIQVKQLLSLANRSTRNIFKEREWSFLRTEWIVNIGAPVNITGNVSIGSTTVTNCSSTVGLDQNYAVSGVGMPQAQRITSVTDATTIEMEMESTADGIGVEITCARDTFDLPSDYDHTIGQTWWDRTNHWMLIGPDSPQTTQWLKSGIVATGPRRHFTQIGKNFPSVYRIWPPPTSQDTPSALSFEYISNGWIVTQEGTYQSTFTADTDQPVALDQSVILDVKWRWQQIKGASYGALQAEFMEFLNREKARDGQSPILALNARRYPYLITTANVQDGFFPGPA